MGLIPIWDVGPFYAAQQQGYFAAENVSVAPQVIRGGAVAQALHRARCAPAACTCSCGALRIVVVCWPWYVDWLFL